MVLHETSRNFTLYATILNIINNNIPINKKTKCQRILNFLVVIRELRKSNKKARTYVTEGELGDSADLRISIIHTCRSYVHTPYFTNGALLL